jgi:lycopene cyclase domain-containing protein
MPEYLLILALLFLAAFFLHKATKVKLFASFKHMLVFYLIFILIGVVWDQYAIFRGHWLYRGEFLTGIRIGYMPIEDYAFGFIVTYFGLVLYKVAEKNSNKL